MRWNALTLGFHRQNSSHSSQKYLWIRFVFNRARSTLYSALAEVPGKRILMKYYYRFRNVLVTWRSGNETGGCTEGPSPEFDSGQNLIFFFSFFFSFTFSLRFGYCSFVLFLYIDLKDFLIHRFSSQLPYFPFNFLPFSGSPSRSCDSRISSIVYLSFNKKVNK